MIYEQIRRILSKEAYERFCLIQSTNPAFASTILEKLHMFIGNEPMSDAKFKAFVVALSPPKRKTTIQRK